MTIMETTGGAVRGLDHGDHLAFLGVPFADPPYPDHPFDPPRRLRGWAGVRDATTHGASVAHADVAQHLFPDPVVAGTDCLNLTVHAPPPSGDLHPVLVWLYGGGYFSGTNASPWYSGEAFARAGVVLVVPNHRVGAEGFAVLDDGIANRALLDVVAALRWVRDNIERFGGDSTRVTLAGQSSGAMTSLTLLGSPEARPLFRRVAALSPATPRLVPLERARATSRAFAAALEVPPARAALGDVDLRGRLALESAWLPLTPPDPEVDRRMRDVAPGALRWAPSVDDVTVTATAAQALADGLGPDALMIGTTTQEWNLLVGPVEPAPSRDACVEGLRTLGLTDDDLRDYLAALRSDNPGHAVAQALTDQVFRAPARRLADTATAAGVPTFAYQFAWPAPVLGAHHCADLRFVFDHLDLPGPGDAGLRAAGAPQHLATAMHDALVRFARHGEPGWAPYRLGDRSTMAFAENPRVVADGFTRAPHELT